MSESIKELLLYRELNPGRLHSKPFSLFIWLLAILLTIFWGSFTVVTSIFPARRKFHNLALKYWSKEILFVCGVKINLVGGELLPDKPAVYVANHTGLHDIPALSVVLPASLSWMAKASLFKIPFLGWAMTRSGYIPVKRDGSGKTVGGQSTVGMATEFLLNNKSSLVIFPEGTRSRDGRLAVFRRGAFAIAKAAKLPIIPITIEGSWRVVKAESWCFRYGHTIDIVVHPPIDTKELSPEELAEKASSVILTTLIKLRKGQGLSSN